MDRAVPGSSPGRPRPSVAPVRRPAATVPPGLRTPVAHDPWHVVTTLLARDSVLGRAATVLAVADPLVAAADRARRPEQALAVDASRMVVLADTQQWHELASRLPAFRSRCEADPDTAWGATAEAFTAMVALSRGDVPAALEHAARAARATRRRPRAGDVHLEGAVGVHFGAHSTAQALALLGLGEYAVATSPVPRALDVQGPGLPLVHRIYACGRLRSSAFVLVQEILLRELSGNPDGVGLLAVQVLSLTARARRFARGWSDDALQAALGVPEAFALSRLGDRTAAELYLTGGPGPWAGERAWPERPVLVLLEAETAGRAGLVARAQTLAHRLLDWSRQRPDRVWALAAAGVLGGPCTQAVPPPAPPVSTGHGPPAPPERRHGPPHGRCRVPSATGASPGVAAEVSPGVPAQAPQDGGPDPGPDPGPSRGGAGHGRALPGVHAVTDLDSGVDPDEVWDAFSGLSVEYLRRERRGRLDDLLARQARIALAETHRRTSWDLHHDALTGLGNRLLLLEHMATRPVGAVLFVDLDRFKQVNDTFGHPVGDQVLVRVARIVDASVREHDQVVRYGGDEFVVLLADGDDAVAVGERVLTQVRDTDFGDLCPGVAVGVSVGVARGGTAHAMLAASDANLLQAKRAGRGRVVR